MFHQSKKNKRWVLPIFLICPNELVALLLFSFFVTCNKNLSKKSTYKLAPNYENHNLRLVPDKVGHGNKKSYANRIAVRQVVSPTSFGRGGRSRTLLWSFGDSHSTDELHP